MPIDVESAERRREIGEAGLRVVRDRGATQLTVRAVAEEMGGSTSLVTHYVRNRRELLALTFTAVQHRWAVTEHDTAAQSPARRLDRLAQWGVDWTSEEDAVVAALLIQILADTTPSQADLAPVHEQLDSWHRELGEAAEAAHVPDPWAAADLLYLMSRGAMLSTVEHPEVWTQDRLTRTVRQLTRLLRHQRD